MQSWGVFFKTITHSLLEFLKYYNIKTVLAVKLPEDEALALEHVKRAKVKVKCTVVQALRLCTGTEALYRLYGP